MTYQYAVLVREFKVTLDELWEMTPRQINTLYFHASDKEGKPLPPAPKPGPVRNYETGLEHLIHMGEASQQVGGPFKFPPEVIAEMKRRLEESRAKKAVSDGQLDDRPS